MEPCGPWSSCSEWVANLFISHTTAWWLLSDRAKKLRLSKSSEPRGQRVPSPSECWNRAGERIFFHRNNVPSLLAGYTQICIAGLQESSPEEPSMQQWRLQRSKTPSRWVGAYHPSPSTPLRLSLSGFELALPPECSFRSDITDVYSYIHRVSEKK